MSPRLLPASIAGLLLGASLALAPACGMSSAGSDGESGGGSAGLSTGTGAGGRDGSVEVNPDADQPPGRLSYGGYCGESVCSPGEIDDGCGAAGEGGAGGEGGSEESCKLVAMSGTVSAACAASGSGAVNGPCQSSADCGPGLGCVAASTGAGGEGGTQELTGGLCRPYCCGELEACPSATFCALAAPSEDPTALIPVCVPTEPCQLLAEGGCGPGKACTIVRADGTTSCAEAGDGVACSPCPCAEGYVCATATGTCHKLCQTDGRGECGSGSCQGGTLHTPSNIGICVGGEAECG